MIQLDVLSRLLVFSRWDRFAQSCCSKNVRDYRLSIDLILCRAKAPKRKCLSQSGGKLGLIDVSSFTSSSISMVIAKPSHLLVRIERLMSAL